MKQFSTIKFSCILALFALSFASCDVADISTKVSIRFENISDQDIQLVTIDGLVIDEIKAGETTDYLDFKDIEMNASYLPNLDITSDAFDNTYTYTYYEYNFMYCGIDCFCGNSSYDYDENQKATMLAKSNYTIQLNADVRAQQANDDKILLVSLVED